MTTKFKPYQIWGSIIYSPRNKPFLEQFARAISKMTEPEKMKTVGKTIKYKGIPYIIVLSDRNKIVLASNTKKPHGMVYTMED